MSGNSPFEKFFYLTGFLFCFAMLVDSRALAIAAVATATIAAAVFLSRLVEAARSDLRRRRCARDERDGESE
jgi:Flp pilus assembly protein TadB